MSHLIKALKPNKILEVYKAASAIQSRQGHFFPEYKPGPVPKTEEERIRAAKKYNLLPEEYECYEEGEGYGDYPKRPFTSVDSQDPWYPWDNQELKRNFNDPPHVQAIILLPEMLTTAKPAISNERYFCYFFAFAGSILAFFYWFSSVKYEHPLLEKQLVTPGVTHYTFELDYAVDLRRGEWASGQVEVEAMKDRDRGTGGLLLKGSFQEGEDQGGMQSYKEEFARRNKKKKCVEDE